MRFTEFDIKEDVKLPPNHEVPKNMRQQSSQAKPTPDWVAKSALSKHQDVADFTHQSEPAYQRKGKPEPITKPVPGTKPKVNLADPKQAAAYQASIGGENPKTNKPAVWTNNRTGVTSSTPPGANYTSTTTTDKVGSARPGEPTMGKEIPSSKPNVAAGVEAGVEAGAEAGAKAGAKSIGKKVLGRVVPGAGVALDAEEAYRRYQKGDRTGAVISALGAAGGLVPGFGPAISFGAAGVNAARDMIPDTPATSSNKKISQANTQAANKGMGGRGSQSPVKPPVKTTPTTPTDTAPNTTTNNEPTVNPPTQNVAPAAKPSASTGTSAPAQSSEYKGSVGAQNIQKVNPNKIANVNKIYAGDTINLPGGGTYTIKAGDTLDSIAKNQQYSTPLTKTPTVTKDNPDNQMTNVIPNDNMAENATPLNRIKSLAGLK